MIINSVFAVCIAALSVTMMWQHWHSWCAKRETVTNEHEGFYLRRQYRRRMKTSGVVGLVGLSIFVGYFFPVSVAALAYWTLVVLMVSWILLLAFADLWSTRLYLADMKRRRLVDQVRSTYELKEQRGKNGKEL